MTPSLSGSARLLWVWLKLSALSFGGGTATLALIRRAAVDEQKWVTETEFGRLCGLIRLAPGINLIALAVLLGRQVAGTRGIALSLLGLLLPSVTLTIALTAGYTFLQHSALAQSALRGIVPAVAGLGLLTAWQIARPLLTRPLRLLILGGSLFAACVGNVPVLAILVTGGLLGAAESRRRT